MTTKNKTKNPPSIWPSFGPEVLEQWLVLRRFQNELRPHWERHLAAEAADQKARNALAKFRSKMPKDRTEKTLSEFERAKARLEAGQEAVSTAEHDSENLPEGTPAEIRQGYENRLKEARQRLAEHSKEFDSAKAENEQAHAELEEPKGQLAKLEADIEAAQKAYVESIDALPRPHADTVNRSAWL